jgi:hypothetical protein
VSCGVGIAGVLSLVSVGSGCASSSQSEDDAGTDASTGSPLSRFGGACDSNLDCAEGFCAGAGVCTRECQIHDDCSCPVGTTNEDVLAGRCDFACFSAACTIPCTSDIQCAGDTSCVLGDVFDACL